MAQPFPLDPILIKLQRGLLARNGVAAFKHVVQSLRSLQHQQGVAFLAPATFFQVLEELGAPALSASDKKYLTFAFDEEKNGKVCIDAFLRQLTGGLNQRRLRLVKYVFSTFAQQGQAKASTLNATLSSAAETAADKTFPPSSPSQFDKAFAQELADAETAITFEEFLAFYAAVALANAVSDDDFELNILREWNADSTKRPLLNETHRDWSGTSGGDPLAIEGPMLAKHALSHSLGTTQKSYNADHMTRCFPPRKLLPVVNPDYVTTTARSFPKYSTQEIRKADPFFILTQQ